MKICKLPLNSLTASKMTPGSRWLCVFVHCDLPLAELRFFAPRAVPLAIGSRDLRWGLSPLHEIIDTFALLFPGCLPSSAQCRFPHLGMTIAVVILKVFFIREEPRSFQSSDIKGLFVLKILAGGDGYLYTLCFLLTSSRFFALAGRVFCVSSCCVTPFPLPSKRWAPYRPRSHNWECIQRPLVQEVGSNPKKPWSSKLENTGWMAFSCCCFQVEFVFGLKEFIQVLTNIPALWTGWNVETSKS